MEIQIDNTVISLEGFGSNKPVVKKQPMSPEKKKKIMTGLIILGGVATVGALVGGGAYLANQHAKAENIKKVVSDPVQRIPVAKPTTPSNMPVVNTTKDVAKQAASIPKVAPTAPKTAIDKAKDTVGSAVKDAHVRGYNSDVFWNGQRVNPTDVHGDALESFVGSIYKQSVNGYRPGSPSRTTEIHQQLADFGAKFVTDEFGTTKLNLKDPRTKEIWDAVCAANTKRS